MNKHINLQRTLTYLLLLNIIFRLQAFTPLNTHPEIQLGLTGISSYGSPMFANAMYMETRGWKVVGTNAAPAADQLDELGYPKYLTAGTKLYVNPGQNSGTSQPAYGGRICISWEGNADIRCSGTYLTSSTPSTGMVLNGRRFYNNGTNPSGVYLVIYEIDPTNPPKNIRIWLNDLRNPEKSLAPEEQGGITYFLHPTFADRFGNEAFFMFRFMDWTVTNETEIVNWNDRRKPDHCFQEGKVGNLATVGVCYEDIISVCNTLGKDMWINIPARASEDFVKKLAALIDGKDPDGTGFAGLNKNLRCYVEYANEVGWGFHQSYCTAQGALQSPTQNARTWAAYQKARVSSWFRSVVGATNEQYKIVQAIQSANQSGSDSELKITCTTYGPTLSPSGSPDLIACTSYISNKMEEYIFNELNYRDNAKRDEELSKFFLEYEKRSLQSLATETGVDFTSGISSAATELSKFYNKPLCIYEGGSGMTLNANKSVLNCKVVASGTSGSTSTNFYNYIETCGSGNQAAMLDFLKDAHNHSLMYDMFRVAFSLSKNAGVQSLSQFGDIQSGSLQYGYWACMNDLFQDVNQAYRYKFWLDWYNEQKDIREMNDSLGIKPHFITKNILKSAKVTQSYNNEILFSKGDGNNMIELISRKEHLPAGLIFSVSDNKIVISGTPDTGSEGDYYFLYRILDVDKDAAYGVFKLKILPAPKDTVFAYDDFGSSTGAVYQQNTGTGFYSYWVQSNSAASDIFIKNDSPLSYPGLKSSAGSYLVGGINNRICARSFDVSKFDYLINTTNPSQIRQPNTGLWMSALVRRTENNTNRDFLRLLQGTLYTDKFNSQINIQINSNGYFQLDCINPAFTAFTSVPTNIYCNPDQTYLMVLEVSFGTENDSVKLYINPSLDHSKVGELIPNARFGTSFGQTYPLTKYAFVGKNALSVSIDDVRFGDSFKAVTPSDPNALTTNPQTRLVKIFNSNGNIQIENNIEAAEINVYNCIGTLLTSQKITDAENLLSVPYKGLVLVNYRSKSLQFSQKVLL